MGDTISRRDLLRILGASGLIAGAGPLAFSPGAWADDEGGASADKIIKPKDDASRFPARIVDGKVIQPQHELSVLAKTDVLVVGGGPAGVSAALAARKAGAEVTLVERYGHFGGQWTGGLVLVVMAMFDKDKTQVTRGMGEELLQALDKLDRAVIGRKPGVLPTVDAEALKYVMVEKIREAGVNVFLHCWGVDAILDKGAVAGAVFESKSGRQAILSKVVVDATGDGDVFAAAGAAYSHRKYHVGLVCRIGNVDKADLPKNKEDRKRLGLGSSTPIPGVNWINMRGRDVDACNVADLTQLEMDHRRQIWQSIEKLRKTPGMEKICLLETAPQLGVRISRILEGTKQLTMKGAEEGATYPDVIGFGGMCYNLKLAWQIPYGALVPSKMENILAAGRCISTEPKMLEPMRLIAPCFVTGHAAGAAAALAVKDRCKLREVEVPKLQKLLKEQGAYLG